MLFRSQAASCQWEKIKEDRSELVRSIEEYFAADESYILDNIPPVHAFEALKWSCITLAASTQIASVYARKALKKMATTDIGLKIGTPVNNDSIPFITISKQIKRKVPKRKIRIGYIS